MSNYQLFHGDCLTAMADLPDQSIDCTIADVPYGRTNCHWDIPIAFVPMWRNLLRLTRPDGAIVLFGRQPFTTLLAASNLDLLRYEIVWEKSNATGFLDAQNEPLDAHENILIFGQQRPRFYPQKWKIDPIFMDRRKVPYRRAHGSAVYGKQNKVTERLDDGTRFPLSVICFASERHGPGKHPTQKPLDLLEYLVRSYTLPGDVVLDFCMGSGTTGHACANLGRQFVGIELDRHWFDHAADRIESAYHPLIKLERATAYA